MEFNPDPSKQAKELLYSCEKNSPNHPSLFFNGTGVPKVNEQKYLGLILDSKLSFEKHINEKNHLKPTLAIKMEKLFYCIFTRIRQNGNFEKKIENIFEKFLNFF